MIADLPNWADVQFLQQMAGTLLLAAILLVLVLLFVIRSLGAKLIAILLIAAAAFALVHYRQSLEHCGKDGCACKLFGQPVPAENCPDR